MAMFDETGVVAKVSADWCDIFVVIDNVSRLFTFTKGMFYIIGKRCVVDMNSALEFGMNVNLCYKRSPLDGRLFLLAVWIGAKPDTVTPTKSIYNQRGLIRYVTCDHLVVRDDGATHTVFIDKGIIFPYGERFVADRGGSITYDAVMKDEKSRIYEATCAWSEGTKPNVYDRFFRDVKDIPVRTDENTGPVRGVVSFIPNDDVTIVDVDIDRRYFKVLLMQKYFDTFDVGDILCLRVDFCEVEGRKLLFATEARKDGVEVLPNQTSKSLTESKTGPLSDSSVNSNPGAPFGLLRCSDNPLTGIIKQVSTWSDLCYLSYKDLKIHVDRKNVYLNGVKCSKWNFFTLVSSRIAVHFEAVFTDRFDSTSGFTHDATCVWTGEKPSLFEIMSQNPHPQLSLLKMQDHVFGGIVYAIYLPDVALVYVYSRPKRTTVLLPVTAFGKSKDEWITNFVKLNDRVEFTVGTLSEYPETLCAFNAKLVNKK